jgi:hypothetical protein
MPERQEILSIIEEAILTHERTIAEAELKKAAYGSGDVPPEINKAILHAETEINRLEKMRQRIAANSGNSPVTQREQIEALSAQVSEVRGAIAQVAQSTIETRADVADIKVVVDQISEGCPLLNPDMKEGPLWLVRNADKE